MVVHMIYIKSEEWGLLCLLLLHFKYDYYFLWQEQPCPETQKSIKTSILTIKARDCVANHKMETVYGTKGLQSSLQCL